MNEGLKSEETFHALTLLDPSDRCFLHRILQLASPHVWNVPLQDPNAARVRIRKYAGYFSRGSRHLSCMPRFPLFFVGLLAVGLARADEPLTGQYRLRIPEDALRVAKLTGKTAPFGRLALREGGLFALETESATRKGRFRLDKEQIVLTTEDGSELKGEVRGGKVTVEGLDFERAEIGSLVGLWTVRRNGLEEKGLRMELKKDGKFRFSMAGASSEGTWCMVDGKISLSWTKIDDEAVEPGSVRKEVKVSDDGISFQIDTYRYERASEK